MSLEDLEEKMSEIINEYVGIVNISPEHIDKYMQVYDVGEYTHLDILQEECAELIQAISKYKRPSDGSDYDVCRGKIIEEMTHVAISSEICCRLLCIDRGEIDNEVKRKDAQIVLGVNENDRKTCKFNKNVQI